MRSLLAALLACLLASHLAGCSGLLGGDYRYGAVRVGIVDEDGAPVPGVGLLLYTGVRHMGYGTSDASGRHRFDHVPFGEYGVVAVLPPGYAFPSGQPGFVAFSMGEGEEVDVSFRLRTQAE